MGLLSNALLAIFIAGQLSVGAIFLAYAPSTTQFSACGTERWPVKVASGPSAGEIDFAHPLAATVNDLRGVAAPKRFSVHSTERYLPVEKTVFKVAAVIVGWKLESDSDFHIVIRDPKGSAAQTMVVEIPAPSCAASSRFAAQLSSVRNIWSACFGPPSKAFKRISASGTFEGVGFFDIDHGQTGRAELASSKVDVELHPIIGLSLLQGCETAGNNGKSVHL